MLADSRAEASIGRRLTVAVAAPALLLLIVGAILTVQVVRMSDEAAWVDHTDEGIARIYEVQTLILNQETALRGYLLTKDRSMIGDFNPEGPLDGLAVLRRHLSDNADQVAHVDSARDRYNAWWSDASRVREGEQALAWMASAEATQERRRLMDLFRDQLRTILRIESALRHERAERSHTTNRFTFYLVLPLLLVLGAAIAFITRRQLRSVAGTYEATLASEKIARDKVEVESRLRAEHASLSQALQGDVSVDEISTRTLERLVAHSNAVVGAFYLVESTGFRRVGGHALVAEAPVFVGKNDGLLADAARAANVVHIKELPRDYLRVRSGVGESQPAELVLLPCYVGKSVLAMVELGFFVAPTPIALDLFSRVGETVGLAVQSAVQKVRLRELLEESQQQAEELQAQQEEVRVANEELQQQGESLREAQALLEERKEELETSNASLAAQRDALANAQHALAQKAYEAEQGSRYKSEFLANMSHELRTPLNSTLILAKLLADNRDQNLTAEQVKFANTIYSSGNDLLALINDVLDISKIEAGKIDVHPISTTVSRVIDPVQRTFEPVAKQKQVSFEVDSAGFNESIETDTRRVQQVLRNLLSNAFKFTERGGVKLLTHLTDTTVSFVVQDSGIGIALDQQRAIFEPFRQVDGAATRKYGGTGLGLSISRDFARLLGGDVTVESEVGKGSRFTLSLPRRMTPMSSVTRSVSPAPVTPRNVNPVGSRAPLEEPRVLPPVPTDPNRRLLLVVEDDQSFADILADLARELEFQILTTESADEAVRLAVEHVPTAIVLDVNLPDHSGLSALDRLKRNPRTRHIPVHVISVDNHAETARSMGAMGSLVKPVARDELASALRRMTESFSRARRLLIVEDDSVQREAVSQLLGGPGVEIVAVETVADALLKLRDGTFDCVVTDLSLPDGTGYDMLEKMAGDDAYSFPPVIVYTGRSLTAEEEQKLRRYSHSIIVKGARSPERLLDEVTLFLHQVESDLPPERQRMLRHARDREAVFENRRILVAEDDVRNIFALTSMLEPLGAQIIVARNGREALEALDANPDIDLVLMDIMMPEMDGLEAMRQIRKRSGPSSKLPIIALTAKAMRDDQELCLAAGANDYAAKPLDVEMLLSLIRVWMPK